jgi:outer membrane protein assembly factor BamB
MFQADAKHTGARSDTELDGHLKENWTKDIDDPIQSSAVVASGQAVITTRFGAVYSFDVQTGKQTWGFSIGEEIVGSPAVADGIVCIPVRGSFSSTEDSIPISPPGELVAFDINNGDRLWRQFFKHELIGSPTIWNGDIYVVDAMGVLKHLQSRTGEALDKWEIPELQIHSPTIADGIVYSQTNNGESFAIDLADGEI